VAIAASRAGHTGLLDIEYSEYSASAAAVAELARFGRGSWGIKATPEQWATLLDHTELWNSTPRVALLIRPTAKDAILVERLRKQMPGIEILVEIIDAGCLSEVEALQIDGIVAKGYEAGGRIGSDTTLILVQKLLASTRLPIIALGGVGPNVAAAFRAAGAAGVALDWQLALFDEADLTGALVSAVKRMDGSETRVIGADGTAQMRIYAMRGHAPGAKATALEETLQDSALADAVSGLVKPDDPSGSLWVIGQDAAFAETFRRRHGRLGAALTALAEDAETQVRQAADAPPLAEHSPFANATGVRFPIVQGPMTRVSDVPDFAEAVAEAGALPFIALALQRGEEAGSLLRRTHAKLQDRPWGVGILGFVDDALREEQTELIAAHRPNFALIAGGRPDQALALEKDGIPTFLHAPSPGLISLFLQSGARRLVVEGCECGGHVGPRSSAVLWQQAIEAIEAHFGPDGEIDCDILFAGGIHDARSGAMVQALTAGLARRGARIGVVVGTAYILTREAVETGAILPGYQALVLSSATTRLLASGPGHATRVADSPIVAEFLDQKVRLLDEGLPVDKVRERLERFTVGRSRIASKGIDRNPEFELAEDAPKFLSIGEAEQRERGVYMIGQAAGLHRAVTTMPDLHHQICTASTEILADAVPSDKPCASGNEGLGAQIAITGMGAILPKARGLDAYWENILDEVSAIEEVPRRRWDWRRYFDPDKEAPDKTYSRWGGFVDELPFDPIRYGIPPKSIPQIEPLQLLALEAVREALEDAGFENGHIADPVLRQRTCVIIGVGGGAGPLGQRYAVRTSLPAVEGHLSKLAAARLPEWSEDSFPGILLNVIAGRIANRFDLGGVNFTVDAACGSSLAAVMAATREIESGQADMAIVGGADSFQNPFDFIAFSKTQALSPRGKCRTFDASADGIAISEGVATLVLRRLEQAEADGDRIYAVLRGVGGSSDGRGLSLTAPRPEGQRLALERAYGRAGVSPSTVSLVEAHGTGTVVGDRAEIESLGAAFSGRGAARQSCAVGSVKSMIGHTKAAAGCAGLVKVAMALHARYLPATLNVEAPNPGAHFEESPFHVAVTGRPWLLQGETPRRAGVSAFGFGGTNFHAVLEEYNGGYLPRHQAPFRRNWTHELFLFSAEDATALDDKLSDASKALANAPDEVRTCDVAAALAKRFDPTASARFALVAPSLADAATRLARVTDGLATRAPELAQVDPEGAFFAAGQPFGANQVAFLFPGQGSQYVGMASGLAALFPEVRQSLEEADRLLAGVTPERLGETLFPPPTVDAELRETQEASLRRTDMAQPAIGAVSLALLDLLNGFGLVAGRLAGHSFGEYVALHAAGSFDRQTLLRLAHARGSAMSAAAGEDPGTMAAIGAGTGALATVLDAHPAITVANRNAPDQTVIAGPTEAVRAACATAAALGLSAQPLPVACGFHSDCVAPARATLAEALDRETFGPTATPVYANATTRPYPDAPDAIRRQLASHLTDPVDFMGTIDAMHADGTRLFVEVGPGAVLSRLTGRILSGREHIALAADIRGRQAAHQFLTLLGSAATAGLHLKLDRLWQGRVDRDIDVEHWRFPVQDPSERSRLWMIDAANVRPMDDTPARVGFAASIEDDPALHEETRANMKFPPSSARLADATEPGAPPMPTTGGTPTDEQALQVMRRHQDLMAQMLENHRDVMQQWLGTVGRGSADSPPESAAARAQADLMPPQDLTTAAPATAPPPLAEPPLAPDAPAQRPAEDLSPDGVTERLLALIADRTGYPPDMLGIDLDLEADLGIDSIKRVEILGALRLGCLPDAAEEAHERMGPVSREKSVRGIVAKFMEIVAEFGGADTEPFLPAATSPDTQARFVMQPQETSMDAPRDWVVDGAAYLITTDTGGTAIALADLIRARGGVPVLIADLALSAWEDRVAAVSDKIAGVLHCAPLDIAAGKESVVPERADWQAGIDRAATSLFTLLSNVGASLVLRDDAIVLCATRMGGAFGFDGTAGPAPAAGAPALLKALAKEWPSVLCRAVDVELSIAPRDCARLLFDEAGRSGGDVEIGHARGHRLGLIAQSVPLESGATGSVLEEGMPILVTGGGRGITARTVCHLAVGHKLHFHLVGSAPLPPREGSETANLVVPAEIKARLIAELRETGAPFALSAVEEGYRALIRAREVWATLDAIKKSGSSATYHACDVRDHGAFAALIMRLQAAPEGLAGVIHGAGIVEDKLLLDKSADSFARVVNTKTLSAHTLAQTLDPAQLRFLIFFTSVAGRFGNRGQADYGAGNEIVSKLARRLDNIWPARVRAISWGPWDGGGMVDDTIRAQFAAQGIVPVPPVDGVRALELELSHGDDGLPEIVWGHGPWENNTAGLGTPGSHARRIAE